jgi:hypothetical protein
MNKPARPILQKSRALSIIKVGDLWHKTGDALAIVLGDMGLEELHLKLWRELDRKVRFWRHDDRACLGCFRFLT